MIPSVTRTVYRKVTGLRLLLILNTPLGFIGL